MKYILFSVLALSIYSKGKAQDTIQISQSEIEAKSLDENLQIKLAQKEADIAQTELLGTRAMYLPNITASYTFINTNNPLMAFGSKLNQERVIAMDFDPMKLNNPKSISNFGTKVEIEQPIFNMDAILQKKAGKVKADILKIKAERTKEYIQYELRKSYMMLQLAYKMLKTLENARATTLANRKMMDNYFKNGMIQKSEILYVDVRLSEIDSQIQIAKSNIKNASDYLYFLLNENSNGKILKPTEPLKYQEGLISEDLRLNIHRKDLEAYNKSLEAYKWLIKSSKSKFLPRLNAFGSWEIYDNKFAQFDANGYLVGLQLSWNIFDGLKSKSESEKYKSEVSKTQAELLQYTKQSELELSKASRAVQDANSKIIFTQKAWEQSKEAYRIRKNRYEQGLEKSADLLSAETLMSQKELEYQQAIFEYNTAFAYLEFLKK